MRKNNKGFTLIELLAVIVILGILFVFSIPLITGMVENGRNKIYISDAKKLVSQAEYRIRSSSSDIEKPDPGDAIAISLLYLDNEEFDNPPNGGAYQKESSFVIVKNADNGKLEYSVTLVEKMKKGGYKGVELTSNNELLNKGATRHVKIMKEENLIDIDDLQPSDLKVLNNNNSYVKNISNRYNNPELKDDSSTEVLDSKPKIVNPTDLVSARGKSFLTLDTKLTIKADDQDTKRSNLKVCYSTEESYCDKLSNFVAYGDRSTFTTDINFKGKYNYGDKIKLYVAVVDPQKNMDKKIIEKVFHVNAAPEFDENKTSIGQREIDKYANTIATVKVFVSDDLDQLSDLQVCVVESDTSTAPNSCSGYTKFTSYFDDAGENAYAKDYQFKCGGTCRRDGSKHYLTVFVKDTDGAISKKTLEYQFSNNFVPKLEIDSVVSIGYDKPTTENRKVVVNVTAEDMDGDLDTLKFTISDSEGKKTQTYKDCSTDGVNAFEYTFDDSYKYDGSVKTLKVKVEDTEGGSDIKTTTYKLYENKAPDIFELSLYPTDEACSVTKDLCPTSEGGNANPSVVLYLEDDLDEPDNSKLKVCVSDDPSYCNDTSHYLSYSEVYENKTPTYTIKNPVFDGTKKKIYAYAIDSYGAKSEAKVYEYKMYKDKVPQISLYNIESTEDNGIINGNLKVNYYINAVDDFETSDKLQFELLLKNGDNYTTLVNRAPLSNFIDKTNSLTLPGPYDGKTRQIVFRVYDKNNIIDSDNNEMIYDYEVYKKEDLNVDDIMVYFDTVSPCNTGTSAGNSICSGADENSLQTNYSVSVAGASEDDLESIMVCVSENEGCTSDSDYIKLSNYMNSDGTLKYKKFTFSPNDSTKPYDGSTKKFHVYVKDNDCYDGETIHLVENYTLYTNNAPTILSDPTVSVYENENHINIDKVTYSLSVVDDLDDSSSLTTVYCKKLINNDGSESAESCDSSYSPYTNTKVLDSSFFGISKYDGQKFKIYSKIRDSYGEVVTTEPVEYHLYKDRAPNITTVDAVYDSNNSEISNFRVSFKATDYSDRYTYCISNNNSTCDNYSSDYISGDDKNYHIFNFDAANNIDSDFYLYLKDSYGNISNRSFKFSAYTKCGFEAYGTAKFSYEELDSTKTYKYYNGDHTSYVEVSGASNVKINIDRCSGKCYSGHSSANNIFGYYLSKIDYKDRFNTNESCDSSQTQTDDDRLVKVGCDFYNCFKKGTSYTRRAIDIHKKTDEIGFTYDNNGTSEICYEYYDEYKSSYTEGSQYITLTKTPNKICATLVDRGDYNYNSSQSDPYVRVDIGG